MQIESFPSFEAFTQVPDGLLRPSLAMIVNVAIASMESFISQTGCCHVIPKEKIEAAKDVAVFISLPQIVFKPDTYIIVGIQMSR